MEQTEQGAQSREEASRVRREKNVQSAVKPESIVIAPKSRDIRLLAKMLISFDSGINNMRLNAGFQVPLERLTATKEQVDRFIETVNTYIRDLGMSGYYPAVETLQQKQFLAGLNGALVFFPKTTEGQQVAHLFKNLDAAFCEFKARAPLDVQKFGEAIERVKTVVKIFVELTGEVTKMTNTRFKEPEGLRGYLNGAFSEPGNGSLKKEDGT